MHIKPTPPEYYNTVLYDTRTIGHLLYQSYHDEPQYRTEFMLNALKAYNQVPFLRSFGKAIWFTDSRPYWRTPVLQAFDTPMVYKGTRAASSADKIEFLGEWDDLTKSLSYPHFEADDLIAAYVRLNPDEKIAIVSVDSDLIQLTSPNVTWVCSKGYDPQVRSPVNGGLKVWLDKKFSKLSKKRIGHLDTSDPKTIVEWKVIYGDMPSDNIPPGEASRCLIDLLNPPSEWDVLTRHPEFADDCAKRFVLALAGRDKRAIIREYQQENQSRFPTKLTWLY